MLYPNTYIMWYIYMRFYNIVTRICASAQSTNAVSHICTNVDKAQMPLPIFEPLRTKHKCR